MAKAITRYVCHSCGAVTGKWAGRCDASGEWNTMVEEPWESRTAPRKRQAKPAKIDFTLL